MGDNLKDLYKRVATLESKVADMDSDLNEMFNDLYECDDCVCGDCVCVDTGMSVDDFVDNVHKLGVTHIEIDIDGENECYDMTLK